MTPAERRADIRRRIWYGREEDIKDLAARHARLRKAAEAAWEAWDNLETPEEQLDRRMRAVKAALAEERAVRELIEIRENFETEDAEDAAYFLKVEALRKAAGAAADCLMNFDHDTEGRARAQDLWDALEAFKQD